MKIGRIRVHPSVFFIVLVFWIRGELLLLGLAFLFATFHEMGHCLAGGCFGVRIKEIGITPLGERAELIGYDGLSAVKKAIVLGAGPFVNLFFGILFYVLSIFWEGFLLPAGLNMGLGLFNMLPVLPLDGGKLFFMFLSRHFGTLTGARFLTRFGCGVGIFFILLGVIQLVLYPPNVLLLCMGLYLFWLNKREYLRICLRFYRMLDKRRFLEPDVCRQICMLSVPKDIRLSKLIDRMDSEREYIFVCSVKGRRKWICEKEVIAALFEKGADRTIDGIF